MVIEINPLRTSQDGPLSMFAQGVASVPKLKYETVFKFIPKKPLYMMSYRIRSADLLTVTKSFNGSNLTVFCYDSVRISCRQKCWMWFQGGTMTNRAVHDHRKATRAFGGDLGGDRGHQICCGVLHQLLYSLWKNYRDIQGQLFRKSHRVQLDIPI